MTSTMYFLLILVLDVVQGTLTPGGTVLPDCGGTQTFICKVPGEPLGWTISGLSKINITGRFRARPTSRNNPRIASNDTGGNMQIGVSNITISGFSTSDKGGIIQCVNMKSGNVKGTATISVELCDSSSSNTMTPEPASGPTDKQTGPASLAALVLIPVVLLVPLIYPLGVLIAKYFYFKDKSYCEVFWWCSSYKKDELSSKSKSTEVMKPPRFTVEADNIQANKGSKEGIQYAALDFSGQCKGKNVTHSIETVTYADV